jgi:hypothetical protein
VFVFIYIIVSILYKIMSDFEVNLETSMDTESEVAGPSVKAQTKRIRVKSDSIRKAGRPYKKLSDDKLKAYVTQLQERVEVAETKYKLYAQDLRGGAQVDPSSVA